MQYSNLLVTGGLGFIGSNFVNLYANKFNITVLDKLTYAANKSNINSSVNAKIIIGDIQDENLLTKIITENKIDAIINFAAESHVDNSIKSPKNFVDSNILGVFNILEVIRHNNPKIRLLHVSTDEVFGSLEIDSIAKFNPESLYKPSSPYSASKAASDHLVRAWHHTYGLDVIITNCSNNYGANQHAEKLIPKTILNALSHKKIPIYGNGKNVRDWIYAEDHCMGIYLALTMGKSGESFLFGGDSEKSNLEVVKTILQILDLDENLIEFVNDRPGHDMRYAIDNSDSFKKLGFKPKTTFEDGIRKTIDYFMQNMAKNES